MYPLATLESFLLHDAMAAELLAEVGLEHLLKRPAHSQGGGRIVHRDSDDRVTAYSVY